MKPKANYRFVHVSYGGSNWFETTDENVDVAETRFLQKVNSAGIKGGGILLFKNEKLLTTGMLECHSGIERDWATRNLGG